MVKYGIKQDALKQKRKVNKMNITDVRVRLLQKEDSKLKAFASITIDGVFVVHDIKVIEGAQGYFVNMPRRKTPDGQYKDIAHPLDTATREMVTKLVLDAFHKELEK